MAAAVSAPGCSGGFHRRQAECKSVLGALARENGVPVVAISGQPGIGKTALALRAAHQARDRFPDGQLWVQLAGASARPRDPGEVLGELLRAFGVPGSAVPDDHAERASVFRSRVAGRRLLVVADDAASAEQVAPLLPGTPGCALIVTSRMCLEGLAGACIMPLAVMTCEEAVDLLARIIGPARVEADPVGVGELAEACGELPLALRVAGARLAARPTWPMSAMTRRLARLTAGFGNSRPETCRYEPGSRRVMAFCPNDTSEPSASSAFPVRPISPSGWFSPCSASRIPQACSTIC